MGNKIKLASIQDIPEGGAISVLIPNGEEIALFKIHGKIFALDNACPHQGAPLAEGRVENSCVTCPWHAWTFDIETGECINMPGEYAKVIPIKIENESIYYNGSDFER